jgi:prohibitin 2
MLWRQNKSVVPVLFLPSYCDLARLPKVAQQTALRAAFLVDQAIQEKQVGYRTVIQPHLYADSHHKSIIVRAQGEARSAELIGEAMRTNKGFLELRRLEAARDIANILAASGNRVMLDAQSLLLNGTCVSSVGLFVFLTNQSTVTGDDTKELLRVKK